MNAKRLFEILVRENSRMLLGFIRSIQYDHSDPESMEYLSQRFESVQRLIGDTLDEKLASLRACIALLPDHERQCIEMRYSQNLMPAELCERLSVALETVKKRLVRAKLRLIDCMTSKIENQPSEGVSI